MPGPLAAGEPAPAESGSAESEAQPSAYELWREGNIRENESVLASLGLGRDRGQPAQSKKRVRHAASAPALVRRTQRPRQCKRDPSVAAAAAARADAVADVQRQPVAAAASEVDAAVRMRRQAAAAAASEDHAAGRMRPRPGPRPKDGTISTECRKDGCPWGAVRGKEGRLLGHGLCRNCAAEARAVAKAERSKRKAEGDAAGEGAEAAVRRQPSDNAKGKARRVVSSDDDDDGAFEEVYLCRTDGCANQAHLNTRTGLPLQHMMCRIHGPSYKPRPTCTVPSCGSRAQQSGRCKLHQR